MGSKRGNLVALTIRYARTHHHDRSYHNRFDHFAAEPSSGHESCPVELHVEAGERRTIAQSWSHVSGLESDRSVEPGHPPGLGGFPPRRLEYARAAGELSEI